MTSYILFGIVLFLVGVAICIYWYGTLRWKWSLQEPPPWYWYYQGLVPGFIVGFLLMYTGVALPFFAASFPNNPAQNNPAQAPPVVKATVCRHTERDVVDRLHGVWDVRRLENGQVRKVGSAAGGRLEDSEWAVLHKLNANDEFAGIDILGYDEVDRKYRKASYSIGTERQVAVGRWDESTSSFLWTAELPEKQNGNHFCDRVNRKPTPLELIEHRSVDNFTELHKVDQALGTMDTQLRIEGYSGWWTFESTLTRTGAELIVDKGKAIMSPMHNMDHIAQLTFGTTNDVIPQAHLIEFNTNTKKLHLKWITPAGVLIDLQGEMPKTTPRFEWTHQFSDGVLMKITDTFADRDNLRREITAVGRDGVTVMSGETKYRRIK